MYSDKVEQNENGVHPKRIMISQTLSSFSSFSLTSSQPTDGITNLHPTRSTEMNWHSKTEEQGNIIDRD